MNIFRIAVKEIKSDFRDVRTLFFMLLFPIVMIFILGTALSNAFHWTISVGDVRVLYKDQTAERLSPYIHAMAQEAKKAHIDFRKVLDHMDGKQAVQEGKADGYVEIGPRGVELYINERNKIKGSLVEGVMAAFVGQYKLAMAVSEVKPGSVQPDHSPHEEYIQERSLHSKRNPGAMDYYAVAMTTMIALYSALPGISLLRGERTRKTADRLLAAPVRKSEIFIGKLAGSVAANFLCVAVVMLFSQWVLHADWGHHVSLVWLLMLTEVVLAISFGLGMSYMARTEGAARTIAMVIIQLSSFFGGAYFPIDETAWYAHLSPLSWMNDTIFKIVYANDLSSVVPTMLLNIGIAALFLMIAVASMARREGL
ncbi:ABC-2 type transporter family protein [Geobacillus kaustophilus]|uniref:ABC-2 type transporter family protein n=1 Tax=Geobacillus kaustophilus TaxID=1462 RepID=A0A0D8C7G1_GEOKU|nr:ABC transporter permease [Geobacillus kaustophilus]KJE32270.1 ABC-2 type transporter family protein [Geobacillus kaustophilus]